MDRKKLPDHLMVEEDKPSLILILGLTVAMMIVLAAMIMFVGSLYSIIVREF